MSYMCNLGLFENSHGVITCLKMASRTDEYTQKLIKNTGIVPTIAGHNPEKSVLGEENRTEENRTEEKKPKRVTFKKPTLDDVRLYCIEKNSSVDPESFIDYYTSNGWKVGKNSMKDWQATIRQWEKRDVARSKQGVSKQTDNTATRYLDYAEQAYAQAVAEERSDKAIR